MDELVKALNDALDGVAGYLAEYGTFHPYWSEQKVAKAVAILRKHDPKASALEYFE